MSRRQQGNLLAAAFFVLFRYSDFLSHLLYLCNMLKVAITGPESTGKSTLSQKLAAHYNTVWVPEYARTYIEELDRPYTLQDLEAIAKGQLALEKELQEQAHDVLFVDTDLLVIKIWSEHAFGECPDWVLQQLKQQDYNLYLLMGVDLPWEPDPQREHPHLRQFFYDWYKRELKALQVPFVEITGQQASRLEQAQVHVDAMLRQHQS
jgi:NadR type nicotinamide-nucleotide adenylyltransferase